MHKLINYYADRGEMLARSLSEIYENVRDYFVVRQGERVIACAALHVSWLDLQDTENIRLVRVPLSQISSLVKSDRMCDAKSIAGLFTFLEYQKAH